MVPKPGEDLTKEEILEFLQDKVAKWWIPGDWCSSRRSRRRASASSSKKELRAQFEDYKLPT